MTEESENTLEMLGARISDEYDTAASEMKEALDAMDYPRVHAAAARLSVTARLMTEAAGLGAFA